MQTFPKQKKLLPLWLNIIIDFIVIAAIVLSFYYINYRMPQELPSDNSFIPRPGKNTVSRVPSQNVSGEDISDNEFINKTEWQIKFADRYSDKKEVTGNSYKSENISVTVTKNTKGEGNGLVTYYVADIYISDITCLKSGFAKGKYGKGFAERLEPMSNALGAITAINGDYYGNGNGGIVIRNGEIFRTKADSSDVCALYYDGTMKTYSPSEFDLNRAISDGAYQVWAFGPMLLDSNGNVKTEFNSSVTPRNPRTAIGYIEPGHYCFVVVDGRQQGYSRGMTMSELSLLMKELGCISAYNLDGGQTSEMTFGGKTVTQPYDGGRAVSDCIFIKEPD